MSKWKFVIVSKDTSFKISPEKFTNVAGLAEINISYVDNNKKPLAEVYNKYLEYERGPNGTSWDYLVFMHADVALDLAGFIKHVEKVSDRYDILGLCGTASMNVMQSPLNWFTSSRPTPDKRWGCVMHGELGNQMTWFSQHSPDVGDHEVACLDGLCLIFTKKVILDRSIRFDSSVGEFDFYDTDLSMQAMMSGLKLGVVVRKDLMHFSVGKSILTPHFLENELKFRKKWNLPLTQNIVKLEADKQRQLDGLASQQDQGAQAPSSFIDASSCEPLSV
jgi:hypothetical protein